MDSRTQDIIHQFEADEDLHALALAEVIDLMTHEYKIESRLEHMAMENGLLHPGGRIDWSQLVKFYRERAEAEFIRNELRRNQMSEEPIDEILLEQESLDFDVLT